MNVRQRIAEMKDNFVSQRGDNKEFGLKLDGAVEALTILANEIDEAQNAEKILAETVSPPKARKAAAKKPKTKGGASVAPEVSN